MMRWISTFNCGKLVFEGINFINLAKGKRPMKRIILILCIFFSLVIYVSAGEIYFCIDRNGNPLLTDSPQEGMKDCVLKESFFNSSSEETRNENRRVIQQEDNTIAKEKEVSEAKLKRINDCINCCNDRISGCYNYTADSRLCLAENEACAAMCKSEGSSPSSWRDCWSRSGK